MIERVYDNKQKQAITATILRELPQWFGIEQSLLDYVVGVNDSFFYIYRDSNQTVGFFSFKETSEYAIELYVCGILSKYRNKGIGKQLFGECYEYVKKSGYRYIHVKTVAEGCFDIYDETNKFYQALGFYKLEILEELWDKNNPCQIYIMNIND